MDNYKFKKYELVKLVSGVNVPSPLFYQVGAVLGVNRVNGDDVLYDVLIPADRDLGECWLLPESGIKSIGKQAKHEELFYTDHKFKDYEVVKILPGSGLPKKMWEQEVAILGLYRSDSGAWSCSISAPLNSPDLEDYYGHLVEEEYLEPTGKFMKHEDFYTGESIRVSKDGELLPPDEIKDI